jgi:UDP-glucose 4-epimerase
LKKILILGASGYIGSRLSYLLSNQGNQIDVVTNSNNIKNEVWSKKFNRIFNGDVSNYEFLDFITNHYYDSVINLISLDNENSNKNPEYVNSVNIMPSWNILELFKKKKNLKQFIYFSTIHVYEKSNSRISESSHTNPNSKYGLTHLISENIVNYFNNTTNISCINFRLSNSYGSPYFSNLNCWNLVVNDFCKTAYYNNEIIIKSDGSDMCDFVHYNDIYNSVATIINKNKLKYNTFNVTSSKSISIHDLAFLVKKIFKKRLSRNISINFLSKKVKTLNNDLIFKNDRLKKVGVKFEIDLENGINELIDYLENEK